MKLRTLTLLGLLLLPFGLSGAACSRENGASAAAAQTDAVAPASYEWFEASTVRELRSQLNATGDSVILKVWRDKNRKLWVHVVPQGTDALRATGFSPLDKSWECPPYCP